MSGVIHGLGGFGEGLFGNQRTMKIDESVKDTVILLSQFSWVYF